MVPMINTTAGYNMTTTTIESLINATGPVSADTFPEWLRWFKPVLDFYGDKENLAYYLVAPLMFLVYVGSAIVYVIGMMVEFFDFKIQVFRNKRLGLPPPKRKKKPKKPNIFERAKAKMVQIEQKREEVKEKRIEEKQKKKEEEVKKQEQLQIKMMDNFDRMKYLNKYYTSFGTGNQPIIQKKESDRRANNVQQMWGGSFAKAYATAFLQLNTDADVAAVELRPTSARPQSRSASRASNISGASSQDVTDLWTMAQIARLERKREEKMRIKELEKEGKRSKWRTLPSKKKKNGFTSLDHEESEL